VASDVIPPTHLAHCVGQAPAAIAAGAMNQRARSIHRMVLALVQRRARYRQFFCCGKLITPLCSAKVHVVCTALIRRAAGPTRFRQRWRRGCRAALLRSPLKPEFFALNGAADGKRSDTGLRIQKSVAADAKHGIELWLHRPGCARRSIAPIARISQCTAVIGIKND